MRILNRIFRREKVELCKWEDSCKCGVNKVLSCLNCKWYWWLDSGYGHCRAMPEHLIVAWCRDICSLFVKKGEK